MSRRPSRANSNANHGETLEYDAYIENNTSADLAWKQQELTDVSVRIVENTALLHAVVEDTVVRGGTTRTFRMPMTQVWIELHGHWVCLGGHAGPLL